MEKIGRYQIKSLIGKGGMGTVYRAVDPVLGRNVALKTVEVPTDSTNFSDDEDIRKCLNEARLSSQLIHPNIVITYDAGFEKNKFYMALEYIEGKSLDTYIQDTGKVQPQKIVEIIFNVCHALDYIHNKGLVHLDVKPANIMVTKLGEVKLMDFGIARLLKDTKQQAGFQGSAPYMSPEQTGADVENDHRSDIFSLGVVLYELLSGTRPFNGDTSYQIMYQIINSQPPPLDSLRPDISPELSAIAAQAMNKKPEERFSSAREFADALLPIIKGKESKILNSHEQKKVDVLRRLIFFKHFENKDLARILEISTWHFHAKDSWIVEESENDSNIYIIVTGRASLKLKEETDRFTAGDCFGESSILFQKPRQAKVKADTDCLVMAINSSILNQEKHDLQVRFLKEFYRKKTRQLVHLNLKQIQVGDSLDYFTGIT